jgi:hypothetical protein
MSGQIPKYGKYFRLERGDYNPVYGHSLYVYKADPSWLIKSDKTSKKWYIFHHGYVIGIISPSLSAAMTKVIKVMDTLY